MSDDEQLEFRERLQSRIPPVGGVEAVQRYSPALEAEWIEKPLPAVARYPFSALFLLLMCASVVLPPSMQDRFRMVVAGILVATVVTEWVRDRWRQRRSRAAMHDFLDGEPSATHMLVEIQYHEEDGADGFPNWRDTGAMILEDDFIAYNSPRLSFLIGGQDVNQFRHSFFASPTLNWDVWIVDIRLAVSDQAILRVRTIPDKRVDPAVAKQFVENIALFKKFRPSTGEKRSLPPRRKGW